MRLPMNSRQSKAGTPMTRAAIVGAGPAGLFCAHALAQQHWDGEIVVFELGKRFRDRFISEENWDIDPRYVLKGEGGAGLFVDAKLCLSPTAGTKFPKEFAKEYPRALEDIDHHIYQELLD